MSTDDSPCTGGPCSEAQQHVWDFLDGEMTESDCARIRSHIEQCQTCKSLFDNEQKIKSAVSRACGCESAPQALKGKIVALVSALRLEACGGGAAKAKAAETTEATSS